METGAQRESLYAKYIRLGTERLGEDKIFDPNQTLWRNRFFEQVEKSFPPKEQKELENELSNYVLEITKSKSYDTQLQALYDKYVAEPTPSNMKAVQDLMKEIAQEWVSELKRWKPNMSEKDIQQFTVGFFIKASASLVNLKYHLLNKDENIRDGVVALNNFVLSMGSLVFKTPEEAMKGLEKKYMKILLPNSLTETRMATFESKAINRNPNRKLVMVRKVLGKAADQMESDLLGFFNKVIEAMPELKSYKDNSNFVKNYFTDFQLKDLKDYTSSNKQNDYVNNIVNDLRTGIRIISKVKDMTEEDRKNIKNLAAITNTEMMKSPSTNDQKVVQIIKQSLSLSDDYSKWYKTFNEKISQPTWQKSTSGSEKKEQEMLHQHEEKLHNSIRGMLSVNANHIADVIYTHLYKVNKDLTDEQRNKITMGVMMQLSATKADLSKEESAQTLLKSKNVDDSLLANKKVQLSNEWKNLNLRDITNNLALKPEQPTATKHASTSSKLLSKFSTLRIKTKHKRVSKEIAEKRSSQELKEKRVSKEEEKIPPKLEGNKQTFYKAIPSKEEEKKPVIGSYINRNRRGSK